MNKTKLTIPCHWDKKVIETIKPQQDPSLDIEVKEVYGVLAKEVICHGRSPESVPHVTRTEAVNFREFIKNQGFQFIYLLNAPFTFDSIRTQKQVEAYLDWVINTFRADALMISSHGLMRFVRKRYPKVKIYISTIAGILNVEQLEKFMDIMPNRVIPHHDVNRNFHDLEEIVEQSHKWNIEVELMLTESCLRRCPNRKAHYEHLGRKSDDVPFHTVCNTKKLTYPLELLKANVIRPEDMAFYEALGVHFFKITGRSKPAKWLPKVTKAYLNRKYEGNLIRLLGIDPSLKAEDWICINNQAMGGFLENFPRTGSEVDEDAYCNKWIAKLYRNGDFHIKDETDYKIDAKEILTCAHRGKFVSRVFKAEGG